MRAECRRALFRRLLPAARIESHERRRRGARGGRDAGCPGDSPAAWRILGQAGRIGPLLKLDANGFLQRAKRAYFFGRHEREGAPG